MFGSAADMIEELASSPGGNVTLSKIMGESKGLGDSSQY